MTLALQENRGVWAEPLQGRGRRFEPVNAHGPRNLDGCEVVFEVEEGQGASLTVTGGFADVSDGNKRCTTAPYPPPTSTNPAVPSGLAPAIAAARADGVEFDFAEDNRCDWFTPEEFTLIVADAYTTHGITPIPDQTCPPAAGFDGSVDPPQPP